MPVCQSVVGNSKQGYTFVFEIGCSKLYIKSFDGNSLQISYEDIDLYRGEKFIFRAFWNS